MGLKWYPKVIKLIEAVNSKKASPKYQFHGSKFKRVRHLMKPTSFGGTQLAGASNLLIWGIFKESFQKVKIILFLYQSERSFKTIASTKHVMYHQQFSHINLLLTLCYRHLTVTQFDFHLTLNYQNKQAKTEKVPAKTLYVILHSESSFLIYELYSIY